MAFINHCGAQSLTLEPTTDAEGRKLPSLRELDDPVPLTRRDWLDEFHGDHTPIRHDLMVDLSKRAIDRAGYDVTSEEYSLHQERAIDQKTQLMRKLPDGSPMPRRDNAFGYLEVARKNRNLDKIYDVTHIVGIRNSNTMDSKASLGCGERVFLCDNMAFSAEFLIFRKHTNHILDDLPKMMDDCVDELAAEFRRADARREIYKDADLSSEDVHDIMMQTIQQNYRFGWNSQNRLLPIRNDEGKKVMEPQKHATPSSRLGQWHKEFKKPVHEEFIGEDAWCLKNAYTEVIKDWKLDQIQQRTQKLTTVMDQHPAIDFENKYREWTYSGGSN